MDFNCEYCNKNYTTKGNLSKHQRTAKYCLKIQETSLGENLKKIDTFDCIYCSKKFYQKTHLNRHIEICSEKIKNEHEDIKNQLEMANEKIKKLEKELYSSKVEADCVKDLLTTLHELSSIKNDEKTTTIVEQNEIISGMMKKYMKKQPRKQIESKNVIYILTTPSLKKERRYILGKAKNLTNRLSTYNKTDEHEIIFYQECIEEEIMNMLEPLVFKKLNNYREQANRERFILPENKDIEFFINTIKNVFEYIST